MPDTPTVTTTPTPADARRALSNLRPPGRVWRCLPGLCEAYGFCPPDTTPVCRHCGADLGEEETP